MFERIRSDLENPLEALSRRRARAARCCATALCHSSLVTVTCSAGANRRTSLFVPRITASPRHGIASFCSASLLKMTRSPACWSANLKSPSRKSSPTCPASEAACPRNLTAVKHGVTALLEIAGFAVASRAKS